MTTLEPIHSSAEHSFSYYGKREGWLIGLAVHRDSDAIERSNWRVIVPPILEAHPDDAAIERASHWLVGWVDYLLVRPGTQAATEAQEWADKLADYPLADEEDYGQLEWDEEWCVRCDHGTREQHPGDGFVCRKFRSREDACEIEDRWYWRHDDEVAY